MCEPVKTSVALTFTGRGVAEHGSYVSADGSVATEVEMGDRLGSQVHLDFDVEGLEFVVGVLQAALVEAKQKLNQSTSTTGW